MSPIAVGLDLLLVGLLLTALFVGWKLNRNLKAMRAGQAGFIQAVAELDAAAARAESGLRSLKAASEDVHDELLTRIETARGLIARLESIADKASVRLVEPTAALAPSPLLAARPDPRAEARPAPRAPPSPRPAARRLDDDLFESAAEAPRQRRPGERA